MHSFHRELGALAGYEYTWAPVQGLVPMHCTPVNVILHGIAVTEDTVQWVNCAPIGQKDISAVESPNNYVQSQ